jgi:hypothetical protein
MSKRDWAVALGLALAVGIGSWVLLPIGGFDWRHFFGPAGRDWHPAPWLHGVPYLPWAALGMAPLAWLPDRLASALVNGLSVVAMVAILRRHNAPAWLAAPLLLSPFGYFLFINAQTDVLILAALLLPAGYDALVLAVKPQVAAGLLLARFAKASRVSARAALAYLAPLALMGLVSLIVWPGWPPALYAMGREHLSAGHNVAPWPWGIPVGLGLLWLAWRRGDELAGAWASPLLVPFLNLQSLLGPLVLTAARWPRGFMAGWCVMMGQILWLGVPLLIPRAALAAQVAGLVVIACGLALAFDVFQRWKRGRAKRPAPLAVAPTS